MGITIADYKLTQILSDSTNTCIYRAVNERQQTSVIIKTLKAEYPTIEELAQLGHEYKILQTLNIAGVIKPLALESYQNGLALIFADFEGAALTDFINTKYLDQHHFLVIAIQLTNILSQIHQHKIIHKNIKPDNIFIDPKNNQVTIIDFSISSCLSKENLTISHPHLIEGTLAYMSPEQTGRMNRSIDYRTDFYSLGVTFYQMLTGQLPFTATDPLELVHCHIAKIPVSPQEINADIPPVVADIVMKLLAKTAEARYQNALGIKADLEKCLRQIQATNKIANFTIGQLDLNSQLLIPQKLYGRETEVISLMNAFERVGLGAVEMILVSGYSGIGKSSLVNEVHKPIVARHGYFISGKFDQFKRNIPYAFLISAFQELIQQLLTESSAKIALWKFKILESLGVNGQVIIDVIPAIAQIIGSQPPVVQLGINESQNRFKRVFQQFIHIFCQPEHPLVLFLDDLQWADLDSLKLIQLLISNPNSQYLLLIGAYRNNEVNSTHPLMLAVDEMHNSGAVINNIILQPLQIDHVNQLVSDTLHHQQINSYSLANLLFTKTQGNPFFLTQLLKSLEQENLLYFNFSRGCWQWDITRLQDIEISDNVVEFMVNQIQKLSPVTQNILKLAACIGSKFTLDVLSIVNQKTLSVTAQELWESLEAGLVLPLDSAYKIPLAISEQPEHQRITYQFLHDRVQQASYSLIPDSERKATHFHIGQLLLQHTTLEERQENILTLVNHLNYGEDLLTLESDKYQLAELNLLAGQKAKIATAYESAIRYLQVGLKLLTANSWQAQYQLTLALYESAIETAYLKGDFAEMDKWVAIVLQQAANPMDKMKVYEVKIQACMAQVKQLEAFKIGLEALELLGVKLPESPSIADIEQTISQTATNLTGKNIADLIHLPLMTEVDKLAAIRMLTSLGSPTYQSAPALFPLVVCEQVNLSVKYGNSPFSAYGYVCYGVILNGIVQDIDSAYQFGKLAINLVEQFNASELKTSIFYVAGACTMYGKVHARETLPLLQEAYLSGLENGQFEYGCYAIAQKCQHSYFIGQELPKLEPEMAIISDALAQLHQENALSWNKIFHQSILNLLKPSQNSCLLLGEVYNEDESLPLLQAANARTLLLYFYLNKLILCYLFGEYPQALTNALQGEQYLDGVKAFLVVPVFHFYDALVQLAIYPSASSAQQEQILDKVNYNQQKMQHWADHAPMNFQHKYDLVEAEKARVLGQHWLAMANYDKAIAGAKEQGYIQEEALANELAAKFYFEFGREKVGQTYLTDAYYGYLRWGATAKVRDLAETYPQIFSRISERKITSLEMNQTISSMTKNMSGIFDISAVMKAAQALSGEIVLDKLLAKLMQLVLENAGAETGFLILEIAGNLVIKASKTLANHQINVQQSIPVDSCQELPISVINYVRRTQQNIVINDASHEGMFTTDSYIIQHQPKSLLCIPIVNQGKLIGILYLENNLTTGVFTSERVEVLQLLSSQAAISIDNARLYNDLEEYNRTLEIKVEERTLELQQEIQERQRAELAAESANRAKSEFLANMSHELRTPLNGILGYTQIFQKDRNLTPQQKNGVEIIYQCGEHLLTLINDILDISKIEARKMEMYPQQFHFSQFLEGIIHMCRIRAEQKGISLVYKAVSPLPNIVFADEKRLRQVLINLLSNAVKFTEQGCITFYVGYVSNYGQEVQESNTVLNSQSPIPKIRFSIEDTGMGISPEQLEEIFLPFKQVGENSRKTEGTGLGLAISRQLVEMMGGELQVKSTLGQGSVFWLDLDLPEVMSQADVTKVEQSQIVGFVGTRRKILVVDDKWENRSVLVNLLQPLGFEVVEATDGLDGVNKASEFAPDVIFMDLVMNVMDGFEATRRIRMLPNLKKTAIIAISASVFDFNQQRSQAVGCDDFLPKPIQVNNLLEKLQFHLGLTWIYQDGINQWLQPKDVNLKAPISHQTLIAPSAEELAILLDLAMRGNLRGLAEVITRLEEANEKLIPFATHIRQLVKGFKGKQIVEFLKKF
ncbi:hybrid sensor histidine kinase/response regulator [Nostoc sp. TCL26-01]|uniref:hybrid sensor histidine kinase/response regulator n=1 Tax=Nostoc sp. TCL26-01 TaxID=2576904 RepID=UPI0015B857AF|nr:hybrid sensor histidine kinase/response regulator [Nostoc sp. TCL26-01]QLE58321.1 response regulator [Nostoc sp. TCL26-01]